MSIRVAISGASGHMGRLVQQAVNNAPDMEVAALIDRFGGEGYYSSIATFDGEADIVIDFSHHEGTAALLEGSIAKKLPLVLCTTGHTEDEIALIDEASKAIPIFFSANMSVGVALLAKLVREVSAKFSGSEIEIVEAHHNRKVDAPSGTALMLANAAKESRPDAEFVCGRSGYSKRQPNEIGINSVRMGNIVGTHEVMFGTNSQTITLKHEAHDRSLFADGAIDAARFLVGKSAGRYNMDDLLGD